MSEKYFYYCNVHSTQALFSLFIIGHVWVSLCVLKLPISWCHVIHTVTHSLLCIILPDTSKSFWCTNEQKWRLQTHNKTSSIFLSLNCTIYKWIYTGLAPAICVHGAWNVVYSRTLVPDLTLPFSLCWNVTTHAWLLVKTQI